MKFYLFIIIFCLIGYQKADAQVFKTGVIFGISATQVEGDGYAGYDKLGLIVGGYTNAKLAKNWSAQFEIYYIGKGSKKNAKPSKGDYHAFKLSLNYIEIPFALRFHYKKFIFETGLYYSALINYKMEDEFGRIPVVNYPIKKYDFGGFIGFYYQLNDHISFNFRSKNSLLPFRNFENFDQNIGIFNKLLNRGWYNVDLNLTARYQFGG